MSNAKVRKRRRRRRQRAARMQESRFSDVGKHTLDDVCPACGGIDNCFFCVATP